MLAAALDGRADVWIGRAFCFGGVTMIVYTTDPAAGGLISRFFSVAALLAALETLNVALILRLVGAGFVLFAAEGALRCRGAACFFGLPVALAVLPPFAAFAARDDFFDFVGVAGVSFESTLLGV